jgi:hypothetical protein
MTTKMLVLAGIKDSNGQEMLRPATIKETIGVINPNSPKVLATKYFKQKNPQQTLVLSDKKDKNGERLLRPATAKEEAKFINPNPSPERLAEIKRGEDAIKAIESIKTTEEKLKEMQAKYPAVPEKKKFGGGKKCNRLTKRMRKRIKRNKHKRSRRA